MADYPMLHQQDFANDSERLLEYAQLCNVFYERELKLLADCGFSPEYLAKRLTSLPFYIKRAAESLISLENPLTLDTQNGTWSAKQKRKSPVDRIDIESNQKWLEKNAQVGLVVVIAVNEVGQIQLRLDCIDAIRDDAIRVNEHGWFSFSGEALEVSHGNANKVTKRLIKSSKDTMVAACCGHQWIGNDTTFPRTLTLRELLLTTVVNWPNLNKPMQLIH